MPDEKLQRTTYRDPYKQNVDMRSGTTLLRESGRDQAYYYQPLARLHATALHGWGVASGLEVSPTLGSTTSLTIKPGVALDSQGQHILLVHGLLVDNLPVVSSAEIGQNPTGFNVGATLLPVTASGIDLSTATVPIGDKYLTIKFWETFDSDSYNDPTKNDFIYWHTPWLRLLDVAGFTNDGSLVVLAQVNIGNNGQVTDLSQGPRQATTLPAGSVHLWRPTRDASTMTVNMVEAGGIQPLTDPTGKLSGLDLTVPSATDEIHLERDGGGNIGKILLGANLVEATGNLVADGDVGIGTTTPQSSLEVRGNITTPWYVTFQHNEPSWGGNQFRPFLRRSWDGSQGDFLYVGATGNSSNTAHTAMILSQWQGIKFGTGTDDALGLNSEFMRITQAGAVGIGTTSPRNRLGIRGTDTSEELISFENPAGTTKWHINQNLGGNNPGLNFVETGVADGRLFIQAGGNVGIGTTSPGARLEVDGSIIARNGVPGVGGDGFGVSSYAPNVGIYAHNDTYGNDAYLASRCCAGDFYGPVYVHGAATTVTVEGTLQVGRQIKKPGGQFQIDHPLDPARKYLSHSFVESPDMKNIYDGVVVLDAQGEAEVELPAWFEALNKDFRYQLTCIGGYAPVYIAQEIHDNRFAIAGGKVGMKVSWQVTGIRQDAWANAHRILVEEDKPAEEQGYYLHPELYGESEEKHVRQVRHPEMIKLMQQREQMKEKS